MQVPFFFCSQVTTSWVIHSTVHRHLPSHQFRHGTPAQDHRKWQNFHIHFFLQRSMGEIWCPGRHPDILRNSSRTILALSCTELAEYTGDAQPLPLRKQISGHCSWSVWQCQPLPERANNVRTPSLFCNPSKKNTSFLTLCLENCVVLVIPP